MSFLLTLCLMVPGVCDSSGLDHLDSFARTEDVGPVERWRPLVEARFPESEVETAMCIISHESGGDPDADNPRSSASGLFQVLGSLWAPHFGVERADLYDPVINVDLARRIWDKQGWRAWSPYQRGLCRNA